MAECAPFGFYSFPNVSFTIDGSLVVGFSDDEDCIMIEPTTDLGTPKVGADGTSMVAITADQSATVTLKLMPNSPHNAWLTSRAQRMRGAAIGGLVFPVGFSDLSSGETGGCTQASIRNVTNIQRGPTISVREWKLFCPCWVPGTVQVNAA